MHPTRIPLLCAALVAIPMALAASGSVRAQEPGAAASGAGRAPGDSTATAVVDSAFVGPLDSLATTAQDSLAATAPDSSLAAALVDSSAMAEALAPAAVIRVAELVPSAPLISALDLRDLRPETLEDVLEWIPGASVRVAGDVGMPAHVSQSPIGGTAPEIWMDGIPTRSPGDLDPGLWDRSAIAVERVGDHSFGGVGSPGNPGFWMQSHEPEVGRVVARSRFSSTTAETYQRAISATTPASGRTLRFDFEEWKTEEGYLYSGAPGVTSRSDAGRSKMRRFRMGGEVDTGAGRVKMFFGRGRRYYRGSVLSADARERWTGELSLALDRRGATGELQARAWHLDFSDDDRIFAQQIDASRTGITLERRPLVGGWGASMAAERWSARFTPDDTTVVGPATAIVLRARAGWTGSPAARPTPWAFVDGAWADHLVAQSEVGGRVGADLDARLATLSVVAERALRVPTLAETTGRTSFDTVAPLQDTFSYVGRVWNWRGSDALGIEKQERLGLQLRRQGSRLQLQVGVDHWRLRNGAGWTPGEGESENVAQVTPDVKLDVNTATASARLGFGLGSWSLRGRAQGQRVLGSLERAAGRGAGWPQWNLRARFVADRRFFSIHNRLGFEFDAAALGPRFDDAVGAFSDLRLPTRWRFDGRVRLSIREAVMSVGYDNVFDTELDEVLGTFRRGRQLRWQLDWTIYN